jgi:environmental stress-induced protein Ves
MMDDKIIKSDAHRTSKWSGGTTTELFIDPPGTDFKLGDFRFRLSTATVESERSEFTSLPGVSRQLMILDGSISICHEGRYSKTMKKFDMDMFEGDWKTTSEGKCTDFNLMTCGKTKGTFKSMLLQKDQFVHYSPEHTLDSIFIYLYSGHLQMDFNANYILVQSGDLVCINAPFGSDIQFQALDDSELIISELIL